MVLGGRVNKGLVSLIQQAGGKAVGLCGKDADIIRARQMVEKDIGFVGEVTSVNPALLQVIGNVASTTGSREGPACMKVTIMPGPPPADACVRWVHPSGSVGCVRRQGPGPECQR